MEKAVFRQIAFPLSAFDYLKEFQRRQAAMTGTSLTNNEALAMILREHQKMTTVGSEEHEQARREAGT